MAKRKDIAERHHRTETLCHKHYAARTIPNKNVNTTKKIVQHMRLHQAKQWDGEDARCQAGTRPLCDALPKRSKLCSRVSSNVEIDRRDTVIDSSSSNDRRGNAPVRDKNTTAWDSLSFAQRMLTAHGWWLLFFSFGKHPLWKRCAPKGAHCSETCNCCIYGIITLLRYRSS